MNKIDEKYINGNLSAFEKKIYEHQQEKIKDLSFELLLTRFGFLIIFAVGFWK